MNVLITGAARGIGAESARRLAARGHRLALIGLEPAAPWWLRAFHPLRGLVQRPQERDVLKIVPELEQLEAADRQARGEAVYAPVGSGGAAADRRTSVR